MYSEFFDKFPLIQCFNIFLKASCKNVIKFLNVVTAQKHKMSHPFKLLPLRMINGIDTFKNNR